VRIGVLVVSLVAGFAAAPSATAGALGPSANLHAPCAFQITSHRSACSDRSPEAGPLTAPAVAASPWITNLGSLGGNSYAYMINNRGLVAGSSELDPENYELQHAFVWTPQAGMTDLGVLEPTYYWSFPRAINDRGEVVGESEGGQMIAYSWTRTGGMVNLGTNGADHSYALDVNSHGLVVGGNELGYYETYHALVWRPDHSVIDLGTLPGDDTSEGIAVNDHGQVVGVSYGSGLYQTFSWTQAGGMRGLGTLGGRYSFPTAENDHGWVVGLSTIRGDLHTRAFLWTPRGGLLEVGKLAGRDSYAQDVNDHGQVLGQSTIGVRDYEHAFLWTRRAGITDLGTLGGRYSYAADVNEHGDVVGVSETASRNGYHAFLWTPSHGMIDLGTLGGTQSGANRINRHGEVVGYAETPQHDFRAVTWTLPRKLV
jgi:probable HAF family extracellular repeat protein